MWEDADDPARAVAVWQAILLEEELRGQPAFEFSRRQLTAEDYAAERIDRLITKYGREVYQAVEKRFRQLREAAPAEYRAEVLEQLVAAYPNAAGLSSVLLDLARLHDKAGRAGAAAQAWRRLLGRGGEHTIASLVGLARAYEQEQCWEEASLAWKRLARAAGDKVVKELDPTMTAA